MQNTTLNAVFGLKNYISELKRELKMREKVWKTIPKSGQTKFVKMEEQKQYDIMLELLNILENCNPDQFQAIAEKALSAKAITELPQADLFS